MPRGSPGAKEIVLQDPPAPTRRPNLGAFVRLVRDEPGQLAVGRAGDWGMVERVDRFGSLTVLLGGFSRRRTDAVTRLTGLSPSLVEPCDRQGRPLPAPRTVAPRGAPAAAAARHRGWQAAAAVALALGCLAVAASLLGLRTGGWLEAMF